MVSRYLAGARLTDLRRLAHLLPHDALLSLIITAGIVVVVLGWRVIVYLERREEHRHEILSSMQQGQESLYQRYEDSSSTYVRHPVAPAGRSEQSLRRTRRSRPPQAEKTGHGDVVPLDRHQQVVSGTRAAAYLRDLAQWARWLAGHGVPLLEANETAAAIWARHLEAAGMKDSTAARKAGPPRWSPPCCIPGPACRSCSAQTSKTSAPTAVTGCCGCAARAAIGPALPALAAARIDAYLADRDDVTALPAIPGSTAAARRRVLFATGTGARMYRAEVRALLRHIGRAAGLPAALAGSLSDGGEDIRDIPCYLNAQAGVATGNGVHLVLQQP